MLPSNGILKILTVVACWKQVKVKMTNQNVTTKSPGKGSLSSSQFFPRPGRHEEIRFTDLDIRNCKYHDTERQRERSRFAIKSCMYHMIVVYMNINPIIGPLLLQ